MKVLAALSRFPTLLLIFWQAESTYYPCRLNKRVDVWYDTRFKNISLTAPTTPVITGSAGDEGRGDDSGGNRALFTHPQSRTLNDSEIGDQSHILPLEAAECWCATNRQAEKTTEYYCLILNDENYCSVPWYGSLDGQPYCYRRTGAFTLAKNLWIPCIIIFTLYFAMLCGTKCGKYAMIYPLSLCFPSVNRRIVERILVEEEVTREAIRDELRILGQNDDGMYEHRTLELKTKSYRSQPQSKSDDILNEVFSTNGIGGTGSPDSKPSQKMNIELTDATQTKTKNEQDHIDYHQIEEETPTCAICMIEIEDGDRIGDLSCGHEFHVDCLKEWVLWRNTCPLCSEKDIATVRVTLRPVAQHEHTDAATGGSGSGRFLGDDSRTSSTPNEDSSRRIDEAIVPRTPTRNESSDNHNEDTNDADNSNSNRMRSPAGNEDPIALSEYMSGVIRSS